MPDYFVALRLQQPGMIDILNRFLIQNKSISIPGLGTIHAERTPARMNTDLERMTAPGYRFRFDKYFDAPDKNFFTYLSMQKQIPDYEAIRIYNQFAQDFRSRIMLEDKLEWTGIGYFQKSTSGEVEFFQTAGLEESFIQLPARKVTTPPLLVSSGDESPVPLADSSAEEALPKDEISYEPAMVPNNRLEKLLYYTALLLLAAGMLVAGIQFGKYGFNTKAWSNRQPFTLVAP